jgi:hypothetical protein
LAHVFLYSALAIEARGEEDSRTALALGGSGTGWGELTHAAGLEGAVRAGENSRMPLALRGRARGKEFHARTPLALKWSGHVRKEDSLTVLA